MKSMRTGFIACFHCPAQRGSHLPYWRLAVKHWMTCLSVAWAAVLLAACTDGSFDQWDRDGNDLLSGAELPGAYQDHFDAADFDGDGFISRSEYGSARHFLEDTQSHRRFRKLRDVPYTDTGDPRQQLNLFLPRKGTGPFPLIVYIHGGGWVQGNKDRGVLLLMPFLRSGEYAGASIGYRLSRQASWPAQLHDCKAAIRWLRANAANYNIDPDRIAIFGSSAGGHLASMTGLTADEPAWEGSEGRFTGVSTRVSCVVTYCGPSDLIALGQATNSIIPPDRTNAPVPLLLGGALDERLELAREA
jgi:dienelactone hydrolase